MSRVKSRATGRARPSMGWDYSNTVNTALLYIRPPGQDLAGGGYRNAADAAIMPG